MKLLVAVLLAGLLTGAIASAQSLEATIPVPQPANALVWNPTNNRVFCAVGYPDAFGAVAVIAGATNVCIDTIPVPDQMPAGMLVEPGSNTIFCAGSSYYPLDTALVTVLNGDNGRVVVNVPVGVGPKAMCYNSRAQKLYVASQLDNTVTVFDRPENTVRATISVPNWPYALEYVPENNTVYCACRGDRSQAEFKIMVINGANDSLVSQIMVGYFPVALCYNWIDGKLYCANNFDGTVSIIDIVTNTVVANDTVEPNPTSLCWDPTTDRVYVGDESSSEMIVIDGATNHRVMPIHQVGPVVAMCRDSVAGKLYCANYLNRAVTVINLATGGVVAEVAVPGAPWALCQNPINGRVYVASQDTAIVTVIRDSTSGAVDERGNTGAPSHRLEIRPNPCNSALYLDPRTPVVGRRSKVGLFDAQGRMVADLHPGANNISRVTSGIYFARSAEPRSAIKVVVQR